MIIETVKYYVEAEDLDTNIGYIVNENILTIIGSQDEFEVAVDEWIADGNIPDDAYTFEERKSIKIFELTIAINERPVVRVLLEDTSTIDIWGNREDQFDIGDRYELMKEDSVPNIYLRDATDIMHFLNHLDIKRCYKAITIHRQNAIEYQWSKEAEIMACTTQAELDAITWTVP